METWSQFGGVRVWGEKRGGGEEVWSEEKRREKVEEKLEEVRVGASSDDLTIHQSALTEDNNRVQLFTE